MQHERQFISKFGETIGIVGLEDAKRVDFQGFKQFVEEASSGRGQVPDEMRLQSMFEEFVEYDDRRIVPEAVVKRKLKQAIARKMNVPTAEMPYASSNDFYQRGSSLEYRSPAKRVPGTRFASSWKMSRAKTPNSKDDSPSASDNDEKEDENSDSGEKAGKWLTVEGMKELMKKY